MEGRDQVPGFLPVCGSEDVPGCQLLWLGAGDNGSKQLHVQDPDSCRPDIFQDPTWAQ